jgi:hypothetical protein
MNKRVSEPLVSPPDVILNVSLMFTVRADMRSTASCRQAAEDPTHQAQSLGLMGEATKC